MGSIHVRPRKSSAGISYYLDYSYGGKRHRLPLGDNLTPEQQTEKALREAARIHSGETKPEHGQHCTFIEFLPTYWQAFRAKGRVDEIRPAGIIDNHLIPRFGEARLSAINNPIVGKDYIASRLMEGAVAGTVLREWQVFMRIMNLAVRQEILAQNKIAGVRFDFMPEATERDRVPERWEMEALRDKGKDADVWRAAVGAAHTGLREWKLLCSAGTATERRDDGPWLPLPKARTKIKGNLSLIPLNRHAAWALQYPFRWKTQRAFGHAWEDACERAGIVDLHFHDIRRLFGTTLSDLGVDTKVIAIMLGHRATDHDGKPLPAKITERYIRRSPRLFRDAVTRLEVAFDPCNLSVDAVKLSPELSPKQVTYSTIGQVIEN